MEFVYRLVDPRNRSTFYVGLTRDVYARFLNHIQCNGNNYAKNTRIHELRAANVMVIMETLETVETREEGLEREFYWIRHFLALGEPLTNALGTGSIVHSAPKPILFSSSSSRLDLALNAYKPGMTCRDLAKVLGVGKDTANRFIRELKARGLIEQIS